MKEFVSFLISATIGIFIGLLLREKFGPMVGIVSGLVMFGVIVFFGNRNR